MENIILGVSFLKKIYRKSVIDTDDLESWSVGANNSNNK